MKKRMHILRIGMATIVAVSAGACHTVKIPKIDATEMPEFSDEAGGIRSDIPKVKDAPLAPTDIRPKKQWDNDARALEGLRTKSKRITMEPGPTEAESQAQYEALKAKAQAYKKDDPATGPIQGFPEYKPRR